MAGIGSVAAAEVMGAVRKLAESKEDEAELHHPTAFSTGAGGGPWKKRIHQKDFFWDQLLLYLASILVALTVLDVSIEFLRGGGVACYTPYDDGNFTRDRAFFVNTYCTNDLPPTELFPVFILAQALLISAPHLLWKSLFQGYFDYFFNLTEQLDRLRDSNTGEYDPKNTDIVSKLESEFVTNRNGIFRAYVTKMLLQCFVAFSVIPVSESVFRSFDVSFLCPVLSDGSTFPSDWPLDVRVTCVYPAFKIAGVIRIVDYICAIVAFIICFYGITWCFYQHTAELGVSEIAMFSFSSALLPHHFAFPRLFNSSEISFTERLRCLYKHRIRNDLDFLIMMLFRSDAGHGQVFKDIQVQKELKHLFDRDHELLHLFINDQMEMDDVNDNDKAQKILKDIQDHFWKSGYVEFADPTSISYHKRIRNPEHLEGFQERFKKSLGSIELERMNGIRNFLYYFVHLAPKNNVAMCISFGSFGTVLELSRAFRSVLSIDFNPFFRNDETRCKKKTYTVNFTTFRVPWDLYSHEAEKELEFDDEITPCFAKPRREESEYFEKDPEKEINFIIVGPITSKSKLATVNLYLKGLHTAEFISRNAILLAFRPLKIGHRDVRKHFWKYKPPIGQYDHDYHARGPEVELESSDVETVAVGRGRDTACGIQFKCHNTTCIYEFLTYKYTGCPDASAD